MIQTAKSCLLVFLVIFIFFPTLSQAENPPVPISRELHYSEYRQTIGAPDLNKKRQLAGQDRTGISDKFTHLSDFHSALANQQDASDRVRRSLSEDRWIALDKLAHLLVSFSLVGIGYAVSSERGLGFSRNQARILSAGGTALIGIAKEIHDYRKGSDFCGKDLTADGLGLTLGILFFSF